MQSPSLTLDEIDDLLYFTRVNEIEDLQQSILELTQKYGCAPKDVILSGIDPESGDTLLHYCSANGFVDLLKALLLQLTVQSEVSNEESRGQIHVFPAPYVNTRNAQGNTALHWASLNGHLEVAKILIDAGADMWIKNVAGHLSIFEAERAGKGEVVEYLLEKGGLDLNPEDLADVPTDDPSSSNGVHHANGDDDAQ